MALNDDLVSAIRELNAATVSLRTLIAREYPTRKEMEREFVRKDDTKRRMTIVMLSLLISSLVCFVGTITTVSTCFLDEGPTHPAICNVMPGYSDAIKRQKDFEDSYENLQRQVRDLSRSR